MPCAGASPQRGESSRGAPAAPPMPDRRSSGDEAKPPPPFLPDFSALQRVQDAATLILMVWALLQQYPHFAITVGGEAHLGLTVLLAGVLLGLAASAYLLAVHCPRKLREVRQQARLLHPELSVSQGLRLGPQQVEGLQDEWELQSDSYRLVREGLVVIMDLILAVKPWWNVYMHGMYCCKPMLPTTTLSALSSIWKIWRLRSPYTEKQYRLCNVTFTALQIWVFTIHHGDIREVCVNHVVSYPHMMVVPFKMITAALVPVLRMPVRIPHLQVLLPFHRVCGTVFVYLALTSPATKLPAWMTVMTAEEEWRCWAALYLLPPLLATLLHYIWQYHSSCNMVADLLHHKARQITEAM